mmetsp:Transcript_21209/g.36445  ORF Transcript_21209/g.36445 Transcript_21209/m.36445 type:complete len:314 (-) Transcript_21209:329-1270(-)
MFTDSVISVAHKQLLQDPLPIGNPTTAFSSVGSSSFSPGHYDQRLVQLPPIQHITLPPQHPFFVSTSNLDQPTSSGHSGPPDSVGARSESQDVVMSERHSTTGTEQDEGRPTTTVEMKQCVNCKQTLAGSEFYKRAKGLHSWCKECCRASANKIKREGSQRAVRNESNDDVVVAALSKVGIPSIANIMHVDVLAWGLVRICTRRLSVDEATGDRINFTSKQKTEGLKADVIAIIDDNSDIYFFQADDQHFYSDGQLKSSVAFRASGRGRTGNPITPDYAEQHRNWFDLVNETCDELSGRLSRGELDMNNHLGR